MREQLFRKKSMERIASPEQLNDYVKVSNPSAWMILLSILLLLTGVGVWGVFGRLDTSVIVPAVCADGKTICYVDEAYRSNVSEEMTVNIDGTEYPVKSISAVPDQITEAFDAYALHLGSLEVGEWVYEMAIDTDLKDGIYEAQVVTESIAPISFLWN